MNAKRVAGDAFVAQFRQAGNEEPAIAKVISASRMWFMNPKFIGGPFDGITLSELKRRDDLDWLEIITISPVLNYLISFKMVRTHAYLYDMDLAERDYNFVGTISLP